MSILEHALLAVRPGQSEAFESAFGEAKQIIAAMPGFRSLLRHFYDPLVYAMAFPSGAPTIPKGADQPPRWE